MLAAGHEYTSFIILIGSLYVVAGGVHIGILGVFTPKHNLFLPAIGAALANVIGTTGALMISIRPYLRGNRWRLAPSYAFFILIGSSNRGGGHSHQSAIHLCFWAIQMGVPFWILEHLWFEWMVAISLLVVDL